MKYDVNWSPLLAYGYTIAWIFWKCCIFSTKLILHLVKNQLFVYLWVDLCFIDTCVYANSTLYWLFQVYIKSSQEVLDLQVHFLFLYFFHFYMKFRINLPISTKQSARILTWNALNLLPNLGENWYLNNTQTSDSWTRYIAPFI